MMSQPDHYQGMSSNASREQLPASPHNFLVSQAVTVATAAALLIAGWLIFTRFAVAPSLGFFAKEIAKLPAPDKNKPNVNAPEPTLNATPTVPQTAPISAADLSQGYARREQLLLLRLQRAEFESKTSHLKSVIDLAGQRLQKWDRRVQSLLRSDEGRKLADSASQFRLLLTFVPLTKTDLEQLRGTATDILVKVTQASSPLTNLKTFDDQLNDIEKSLRSAQAKFDSLELVLDDLIATSKPPPNARKLVEAMAALDSEAEEAVSQAALAKKQELQKRFADEIKTSRQQLDKQRNQLSLAQGDLQKLEADVEKLLAEVKNKRDEQSRELAQQRVAARKRLEDELPAFRDRLSPFISKSYRQLQTYQKYEVVIDAQPISYSALLRVGAIENDAKGLETLLLVSDSHPLHSRNDRPVGGFPKYVNWDFDSKNPEIIRQLKAVQEFLRRHGDALVEAKLLAP